MKFILCFLGVATCLLILSANPVNAANESGLVGDWVLPDGSAIVRIEATGKDGGLTGRVISLLRPEFSLVDGYGKPGSSRHDIKNANRSARKRPVIGMEIASKLQFDGEFWRGEIYDPGSGNSYRCYIRLVGDNFAKVRGYIGFSVIGRTMHWQRRDSYSAQVHNMLSASIN
ncbi:MAG: DUF2147 domain-containing protein [Halioglobus sp.]